MSDIIDNLVRKQRRMQIYPMPELMMKELEYAINELYKQTDIFLRLREIEYCRLQFQPFYTRILYAEDGDPFRKITFEMPRNLYGDFQQYTLPKCGRILRDSRVSS